MGSRFKPIASALCFIVSVWVLHAHAQKPAIRVDDAWIRWLPAGLPAAGYVTLTNTGGKAVDLSLAASSVYADVSIHRSVDEGGTVSMMPAGRITLLAHSSLEFAKAGYHIMLLKPLKPVKIGDEVPITLSFADGTSVTAQFEVRK